MKNTIQIERPLSPDLSQAAKSSGRSIRSRLLTPLVCSLLAGMGVFGGISALFAGVICLGIHLAFAPESSFDKAGTVLLIIAIPMILVGSVFMDEIHRANP